MTWPASSFDYYDAEAKAAIKTAAAATSEANRLKWIRIALAWHNLARDQQNDRADLIPQRNTGHFITKPPKGQRETPGSPAQQFVR